MKCTIWCLLVYSRKKAMAPHSSTLAWKIPWMEEPGGLQSMRSLRVGHDWATSLSLFTFMRWRRKWQPTPVFLPGESQGRESLVGCRLWGRTVGDDWSDLVAAVYSQICTHITTIIFRIFLLPPPQNLYNPQFAHASTRPTPALGWTHFLSVSTDLPVPHISYQWKYMIRGPLWWLLWFSLIFSRFLYAVAPPLHYSFFIDE